MTRIGGFFLNVFHRDKQSQTLPKGPKHTEKHVLSHPRYFRPPFTPDNQPQLWWRLSQKSPYQRLSPHICVLLYAVNFLCAKTKFPLFYIIKNFRPIWKKKNRTPLGFFFLFSNVVEKWMGRKGGDRRALVCEETEWAKRKRMMTTRSEEEAAAATTLTLPMKAARKNERKRRRKTYRGRRRYYSLRSLFSPLSQTTFNGKNGGGNLHGRTNARSCWLSYFTMPASQSPSSWQLSGTQILCGAPLCSFVSFFSHPPSPLFLSFVPRTMTPRKWMCGPQQNLYFVFVPSRTGMGRKQFSDRIDAQKKKFWKKGGKKKASIRSNERSAKQPYWNG